MFLDTPGVGQRGGVIVKDIKLSIKDGEFVYLIGKTGSGKSTLLRVLYGDVPLSAGVGRVAGFDLRRMDEDTIPFLRRRLGIVFQDFQLLSDRNVYQNLAFVLRSTGWKDEDKIKQRILEVLKNVGMEGTQDKFTYQMSGGEQQRIAIARAMLKNAPILILDEATAFADPDNEAKVQAAFARLAKGKTVLMIAHRLSTVANADCIYVVQDGQIAESGTKDELCAQNGLFARMWQEYQASVQWKVAKEG